MHPLYQGAHFLTAATRIEQAPPDQGREVAFVGRSNAGKSSAINAICHQKALARTSKTPGRTQQLIFFELDAQRRLVDLPGYGYAQASHAERRAWQLLVEGYVKRPGPLKLVLVLVDARRGLGDEEHQLVDWLRAMAVPCHLVVTKADKLRASERGLLRERLRKERRSPGIGVSLVSGETGAGLDALWASIAHAVRGAKDDVGPGSS